MKILLVEDEDVYRVATLRYLKQEGYTCESASDYKEALDKMLIYEYDCIILDIRLPGGSGLDLLRELKKVHPEAAVIIASSNNSTQDKIQGLEIGSDDYLVKPYEFEELDARIRSIIRRRNFNGRTEITFKEIVIIPDSKEVKVNGKQIILTTKEYELLLLFIAHKNKVVSKESIAEYLWGDEMDQADSYDFIYTHIKNLRKKLIEGGAHDYVHTVYGSGYKFYSE